MINRYSIQISRATPGDAETICDIRDRAWIETYPNTTLGITAQDIKLRAQGRNGVFVPRRVAYFKERLTKDNDTNITIYVARVHGVVIGYIDLRIDEQMRRHIDAIYVSPEAQGRGVGSQLMHKALRVYGTDDDIFLEVVSYNHTAIHFYERFGFEKTSTVVQDEDNKPQYIKSLPQIEMVLKPSPRAKKIHSCKTHYVIC